MADEGRLVTTAKPVRVLTVFEGRRLHPVFTAKEPSNLLLGELTTMYFDHKDQEVFPLLNLEPGHFALKSEVDEATYVEGLPHA